MIISANKIIYSKTDFRAKENLKSSPENLKSAANYQLPSYESSKAKFLNQGNISFGKKGNYANELIKIYRKDISKIPRLSPEEQDAMFKEYEKTRAPELEKKLVESNLKLVLFALKGIKLSDSDFMDKIQVGNLELIRTVQKFQSEKKVKFSTYALDCIRGKISESQKKPALKEEPLTIIVHSPEDEGITNEIEKHLESNLPTIEEVFAEKQKDIVIKQGLKELFGVENLKQQLKNLESELATFNGFKTDKKSLEHQINAKKRELKTAEMVNYIFNERIKETKTHEIAKTLGISGLAVTQAEKRFYSKAQKQTLGKTILDSLE